MFTLELTSISADNHLEAHGDFAEAVVERANLEQLSVTTIGACLAS
jgi:hypothetical protein